MTKAAFSQFLSRSGVAFRDAETVASHLTDRLTARQPLTQQEWSIVYETIQRVDVAMLGDWLSGLARRAGMTPPKVPPTPPGVPVPYPTFGARVGKAQPATYSVPLENATVGSIRSEHLNSAGQIASLAAELRGATGTE